MKRNRKNKLIYILVLLLLGITLGYAYLNTELQINGTTNVSSANWNIYWDNIQFGNNNVTDVTTPATISSGNTEVTFNVNFKEPGDTYEFTVDAVNDGTIDAMISTFSKGVYASNGTTPKNLPDYLEYTVTYSDGVTISQNHLLEAGETETYKVRVHYKEDISSSQLPSTADNFVFKFSVTYVQADSNAVAPPHPTSFSTDGWATIVAVVKAGNTSVYHVGDTKTVDMGSLGTHTLRIANTTTPAECSTTGFSQTACGFVLEFADIITRQQMNPYTDASTNGDGNKGGWEYSNMRTYVNSDIYNALPSTLKNAIINTTIISGHGSNDINNFTTNDKLYLLDTKEIYGSNSSNYNSAKDNERQLDYYSNLEVTTSNYSEVIKKMNGLNEWWWLRSATSNYSSYFYSVRDNGNCNSNQLTKSFLGVSPAFRLG